MWNGPSSDQVGAAVVAACRYHPDENPLDIVAGAEGRFKSRHFALHALIATFPEASPRRLAALVGFRRMTGNALSSSLRVCTGSKPAAWWSKAILRDVIAAIPGVAGRGAGAHALDQAVGSDGEAKPRNAPRAALAAKPVPRLVVIDDDKPVYRPSLPSRRAPHPLPGSGKTDMYAMLAEAARATQAQTPPGRPEVIEESDDEA